jgi:hypothetical protein
MTKIECATCHKHLGGPADAPAAQISHGICIDCLKKQSPGAYFFGRRRALQERLAAFDRAPGAMDLNGFFFAHGRAA